MESEYEEAERAKQEADWNYEHIKYLRDDWAYDVRNGNTQLGYFDWVISQLESDEEYQKTINTGG